MIEAILSDPRKRAVLATCSAIFGALVALCVVFTLAASTPSAATLVSALAAAIAMFVAATARGRDVPRMALVAGTAIVAGVASLVVARGALPIIDFVVGRDGIRDEGVGAHFFVFVLHGMIVLLTGFLWAVTVPWVVGATHGWIMRTGLTRAEAEADPVDTAEDPAPGDVTAPVDPEGTAWTREDLDVAVTTILGPEAAIHRDGHGKLVWADALLHCAQVSFLTSRPEDGAARIVRQAIGMLDEDRLPDPLPPRTCRGC